MAYSPYFVGPIKVGLQKDLDSYLIPEDAFVELQNAYLWRGRVYKKGGNNLIGANLGAPASVYTGRLGRRQFTIGTRGAGADTYNAAISALANDLGIEPGSLIITDGVTTFTDDGIGGFTVTPVAGNGTVNAPTNYATSAINITFNVGNAGAPVVATYMVAVGLNSPVMGLPIYEVEDSIRPELIGFDKVAAYQYNQITNVFDQTRFYKGTNNVVSWTGSDTDFFDTQNYQGAMFATNNIPGGNFYTITAITNAAAAQVTTSVANNLAVNDVVYFNNVGGMTEINGRSGTVTVAGNPFTISIDTSAYGVYTGGTGVVWCPTLKTTNPGDGIRWFDGYTAGSAPATGWVNFNPPLDSTGTPDILLGCLMMFPYKGYLVTLNTVEGKSQATGIRYSNRARWSQYGSVYYCPPYPINFSGPAINPGDEWYAIPGKGGYVDAPTGEDIIAAEFIKDTLVVYFENSTYKLTYTGNSLLPFLWEKVNTEIGAISTFSTVPFDRANLSIGYNGLYSCDSVNIDRIDRIIPDEVFSFGTASTDAKRVHGIRNFYSETALWTYKYDGQPSSCVYPSRTLFYNYVENSFAIFKETYTCFGHFFVTSNLTWANANIPWGGLNRPWDSFISTNGFPIVVAGNQHGFVFILQNTDGSNLAGNAQSLVIQNITAANPSVFTVPNHNLSPGDFIKIQDVKGAVALNDNIYQVVDNPSYTTSTFTLIDSNNTPVSVAGYTYGGRITVIDNFNITTKSLNPFFSMGKSVRLGYVDFYVTQQIDEECTVTININDSNTPIATRTLNLDQQRALGNTKFWRRVFFETQGEFVTLQLGYSDAQMYNVDIDKESLTIHGIIFWMKPTGRLLNP